jgi:hypothetical protein
MGSLNLQRNTNYKQGFFYPRNLDKFVGKENKAIYRSGLELEYFRILDKNPNVLKWGSEEVVVPYFFENKWHKYYVDLFVVFKFGESVKKYFIELKPYAQTVEPKVSKRKKQMSMLYEAKQWAKNQAKWKAATDYAKKNGWEFHILTEKDLENRK